MLGNVLLKYLDKQLYFYQKIRIKRLEVMLALIVILKYAVNFGVMIQTTTEVI